MSYRGHPEALIFFTMPVRRNLDIRLLANGQPTHASALRLLSRQNLLSNQRNKIDNGRLLAAMVQCVGLIEPHKCISHCAAGNGPFENCVRAQGRMGLGTQDFFLYRSCGNHFYHHNGYFCEFRRCEYIFTIYLGFVELVWMDGSGLEFNGS